MTRARNLFLVTSPFQLITAIEARDHFCPGEENHLLILDRNEAGSLGARHLDALTGDGWSLVERHTVGNARGAARAWQRLCFTVALARRRPLWRGKVFAGDYRVGWFRLLGRLFGESLTGLDDGAASVPMIAELRQNGLKWHWKNGMPKLFSVFATPNDIAGSAGALAHNPLTSLARHRRADQTVKADDLLFIGQVLRRRDSDGEDQEFARLASVLAGFRAGATGGTARYIPHRNEPQEKLARIAALGFQVTPTDQPIELALLEAQTLPGTVISWFSTALFTLNLLFDDLNVVALSAPDSALGSERGAEIALVYDALRTSGIEVREG